VWEPEGRIFSQNSPTSQKAHVFETSGALEGKPCSNSAVYMHVTSQVNKSCVLLLFLHISYIFLFLTFLDTFVPPKREIYFEIVDTNITKESYASYSTFF
jgi:hypothetical protein